MQKLVTIELRANSSSIKPVLVYHHLEDLLKEGWAIQSVVPMGSAGGGETSQVVGWLAVVLEKP